MEPDLQSKPFSAVLHPPCIYEDMLLDSVWPWEAGSPNPETLIESDRTPDSV